MVIYSQIKATFNENMAIYMTPDTQLLKNGLTTLQEVSWSQSNAMTKCWCDSYFGWLCDIYI